MISAGLEQHISAARLARYRDATDSDAAALELYVWNSKMCAAYSEALSWIEIGLRNRFAERLADLHAATGAPGSWWDIENTWFDPWFEEPAQQQLADAVEGLRRRKDPVDHGRVTAQLSFGFWVRLLAKRFEPSLWTPALRHEFEAGVERRSVETQFTRMNRWRNRAAHHESMLGRDLDEDWAHIEQAATTLHPDLAAIIRTVAVFPGVARQRPR